MKDEISNDNSDNFLIPRDRGFAIGAHLTFQTEDKKLLVPVELHKDIGLGLFMRDNQLAVGTWNPKQ